MEKTYAELQRKPLLFTCLEAQNPILISKSYQKKHLFSLQLYYSRSHSKYQSVIMGYPEMSYMFSFFDILKRSSPKIFSVKFPECWVMATFPFLLQKYSSISEVPPTAHCNRNLYSIKPIHKEVMLEFDCSCRFLNKTDCGRSITHFYINISCVCELLLCKWL